MVRKEMDYLQVLDFELNRFTNATMKDRVEIQKEIKNVLDKEVIVLAMVSMGVIMRYYYLIREYEKKSLNYSEVEVGFNENINEVVKSYIEALDDDMDCFYKAITFTNEEIEFCSDKFRVYCDDIDNIDEVDNEEYRIYLTNSIDAELYDDMRLVIDNKDKVNTDEVIHIAFVNGAKYALGLHLWLKDFNEVDYVKKCLGERVPEEYFTIYEKLLSEEK